MPAIEPSEPHTLETEILGRRITFQYADHWVGYSLLGLRVVMGWILFQAGIDKVLDPTWTAEGFLANAIHEGNPFAAMFAAMAGSPIVDGLVMWGLTLTGLGIMLGGMLRWNAFWGAVMMIMFWMASLQGGLLQGFPLEHGWFVDDHIVYAVLLFGLGAFGAGRILGADRVLENTEFVKRNPWLKWILG